MARRCRLPALGIRGHQEGAGPLVPTFLLSSLFRTTSKSLGSRTRASEVHRKRRPLQAFSKAFGSVAEMAESPDVDIVAVTVKVPHHREIVRAVLEAGKHVYCEWPLGNGRAEAEELAALLKTKNVLGVVGTQARVAPEIEYLKRLVNVGYVGEVLSTTVVARGGGWGGAIQQERTDA